MDTLLNIGKTVTPAEMLGEQEWLQYVRAGISAPKRDAADKAADMNNQYRIADNLNPLYKVLIKRLSLIYLY